MAQQNHAVEAGHGCLLVYFVHGLVLTWLLVPGSHGGERARIEVQISLDGKTQSTSDAVDLGEREVAQLDFVTGDEAEAEVLAVPLDDVPGPVRVGGEELDPYGRVTI